MSELRPAHPRSHNKRGLCSLCGSIGVLTETHVPPKSAFNDQPSRRPMLDADDKIVMSRPRNGGSRSYAHCHTCRRDTSPWDDEYKKWAYEFANGLFSSTRVGARAGLHGILPNARPGRFARAALAGMVTAAERLYETHGQFVDQLVAGEPLTADPGLRFLVGITSSTDNRTYVGGLHRGQLATVSLDPSGAAEIVASTASLSSVLHFIPFSLVLVEPDSAPNYPHADCTSWLRLGVDDVLPDFKFALPGIRLVSNELLSATDFEPTRI